MRSPALRHPKSLWSYNPILRGCVGYWPLWHPSLGGSVFKSVDPFGHETTVTGALYQGNTLGRFFDGGGAADDLITVTDVVAIQDIFDDGGTVWIWLNPASDGESNLGTVFNKQGTTDGWYWRCSAEVGGFVKLTFAQFFNTTAGQWETTNAIVPINTLSLIAITYNNGNVANNAIVYLYTGGSLSVLTVGDGLTETQTPVGTRDSDVGSDLTIGGRSDGSRVFDNTILEVGAHNVILTQGEITYLYNHSQGRRI